MKKITLMFLIAGFTLSCDHSTEDKKMEDRLTVEEVTAFVKHYDDLWAKRDTAGMKKAMAENYIYFTSTGNTTTRDRIISWFTPADKYKVDSAIRTEISITVNGNVGVVSSRWVGSGSFDGERFSDDQRCSLTIQKENGELKLVSEHCTQIVKQH